MFHTTYNTNTYQMSESICDNEILSLYLDEHQSNVATNKYLQG